MYTHITDLEEMTHEELATWARRIAARDDNDKLHDAAIDLQDAVDAENESSDQAELVIALLRG